MTQTVKWVFLPFKAIVYMKAFPQRSSKMEQLPSTGLGPLEIMSFKVMACLTNKAHPSEPHRSGFQEGNSLMPYLQTSPSRRKGKSFISVMPSVFPTYRTEITPFSAMQVMKSPRAWHDKIPPVTADTRCWYKSLCVWSHLVCFALICPKLFQTLNSALKIFQSFKNRVVEKVDYHLTELQNH